MRAVIDTPDWGPDILIKILPDLDVAFFNGFLRNKIQVSWQDEFSMQALRFPTSEFHNALGSTESLARKDTKNLNRNAWKPKVSRGVGDYLPNQLIVDSFEYWNTRGLAT